MLSNPLWWFFLILCSPNLCHKPDFLGHITSSQGKAELCEHGGGFRVHSGSLFLVPCTHSEFRFCQKFSWKEDEYQTELATCMRIGMDVYTQSQTDRHTPIEESWSWKRICRPHNLNPLFMIVVPAAKLNSLLVCAWIDCKTFYKGRNCCKK